MYACWRLEPQPSEYWQSEVGCRSYRHRILAWKISSDENSHTMCILFVEYRRGKHHGRDGSCGEHGISDNGGLFLTKDSTYTRLQTWENAFLTKLNIRLVLDYWLKKLLVWLYRTQKDIRFNKMLVHYSKRNQAQCKLYKNQKHIQRIKLKKMLANCTRIKRNEMLAWLSILQESETYSKMSPPSLSDGRLFAFLFPLIGCHQWVSPRLIKYLRQWSYST